MRIAAPAKHFRTAGRGDSASQRATSAARSGGSHSGAGPSRGSRRRMTRQPRSAWYGSPLPAAGAGLGENQRRGGWPSLACTSRLCSPAIPGGPGSQSATGASPRP